MNLNHRLEPLPKFETNYSSRGDALLLAAVLVVGLTFVTPAFSLVTGIPTLVFVAVVGAGYALLMLLLRQLIVGFSVGLIVTAMFKANIPLLGSAYTSGIVGHLEPSLWLFYAPLAGIFVYLAVTTPPRNWVTFSRAEWVFAAFVVWTVLAALFGAVARFDIAIWFSLLMFQALIVFAVSRYVVQSGILSFRTVIEVFALGVCAHAVFGLVQLANGESFGLSYLGAGTTHIVATFSLGPLGKIPIGTYVAGFTGMSFMLAALIVLIAPALVALALRATGWRRWVLVGVTVVLAVVLRATGTDAGKGGFIVAMVVFAYALSVLYRRGLADFSVLNKAHTFAYAALAAAFAAVALFYPSSESGVGSAVTNIKTGGGANGGSSGTSAGGSATHLDPGIVESTLRGLSIPFFDISTLGVRLQQYVIGLDLFIAHPIFGIGGMNFVYVSVEHGLPRPMAMHNIYIALLAGTGLPGFLLYVGALVVVLWCGWQAATADTTDQNRLLLVGVLAGLIGALAFGFWDHLFLTKITVAIPFWILAGALVGEYRRQSTATNA